MENILNKLFLCISCLAIFSSDSKASEANIKLLYDITDPLVRKPLLSDILTLSKLDEDIWQKLTVGIEAITDLHSSDQWEIVLPEANHLFVSKRFRMIAIDNFKRRIVQRLAYLDSLSKIRTLGHSIIYPKIVKEANRLSKINQNCYLLIYSDLMIKDLSANFYNKDTFEMLKKQPLTIKKLLAQEAKLDDLKGVKIYFLFKAHSYEESNRYQIVLAFISDILNEKSTTIQTELPIK
ncbi:MAG: hypothetical protein Q8M15_02175 [Bacteroidota bacterium]|nr:hypothetical protein [Bacteroidota bacterium]